MSLHNRPQALVFSTLWQQMDRRRWIQLFVVSGILITMAFYAATDSSHLHNDILLDGADWSGYALCHRITERSFTINGRQFPLCARCTGMYLGVALTALVVGLAGRLRWTMLPPTRLLFVLLGFIAIMGIDGINSYSHFFPKAPHLYEPQNWLRLLTGMGTGLAMGLIILPSLAQTLWRSPQFLPVIGTKRELIELLILAAITVLFVLSNQPTLSYVMAIASVGGLLLIVTALNTVIILIFLRREGRASTWKQAAIPLSAGFLVAIVELSLISMLRFNVTGTMTGLPGL